jgi:hypothetical protein
MTSSPTPTPAATATPVARRAQWSDARVSAVVEAAYVLEAVRR